MSLQRVLAIIKKSLQVSPRNPFLIFIIIAPFLYVAIFQLIFGILRSKPTLAIYEPDKVILKELKKSKAIEVKELNSPQEVYLAVKEKRVDMGIILPRDIENLLSKKEEVSLKTYVNGDSLAKERAIIAATLIDALRSVSSKAPSIRFEKVTLGKEKSLSLIELFLPLIVLLVILLGAYLIPATFIVQEKEKKTLTAILTTPTTLPEVLLAFGIVGAVLSIIMGLIVLIFTTGLKQPVILLICFILGSILGAEWGLTLGLLSKDMNSLFANVKALNIFLIAPAIIIMFPDWPQWIAKIFPTYYIAHPVFRIVIYGEDWKEVGWEILILLGFILLFILPLVYLSRKTKENA